MTDDLVISLFYPSVCRSVLFRLRGQKTALQSQGNSGTRAE